MSRWFSLRNVAVSAAIVAALVGAMAQPAAACTTPQTKCSQEQIAVTAGTTTHTVRGELCIPKTRANVKIAVAFDGGFSYLTSEYFDPAYAGGKYSQKDAVLAAGMATFVYDQLATGGASDNPADSGALSLVAQTDVLRQVTQWLHSTFEKVAVIGHSLGLQQAMLLAQQQNELVAQGQPVTVDAIAGFGYLRMGSPSAAVAIGALRVPALQTAKYADQPWAANTLTTKDGFANRSFFYNTDYAEPGMIQYDEDTKGVSPIPTAVQAQLLRNTTDGTDAVTIPVFDGSGQYDTLGCNEAEGLLCNTAADIVAREKEYFPNSACFTGYVARNAGHDVNLHKGARSTFDDMNNWLKAVLGGNHINRVRAHCA